MHSLLVSILEYLETFPLLVITLKTHSRPLFSRIHEKHRITNRVWMVVRGNSHYWLRSLITTACELSIGIIRIYSGSVSCSATINPHLYFLRSKVSILTPQVHDGYSIIEIVTAKTSRQRSPNLNVHQSSRPFTRNRTASSPEDRCQGG
jgi:hypothetical protein